MPHQVILLPYLPTETVPQAPHGYTPWEVPVSKGATPYAITMYATFRAPAGTPVPEGALELADAPPFSRAEIAAAGEAMAKEIERFPPSLREGLEDHAAVALAGGPIHPMLERTLHAMRRWPLDLALWAPLRLTSQQVAGSQLLGLTMDLPSPFTCGVIRALPKRGFQCWRGVGGMLEQAGKHDTVEGAEALLVSSVREARQRAADAWAAKHPGWEPEAPVFTSTLGRWVDELPIHIRRGPTRGPGNQTSWDLPVWVRYEGDVRVEVTFYDEALDACGRAEVAERDRIGRMRRKATDEAALELLRQQLPAQMFDAAGRVLARLRVTDAGGRYWGETSGSVDLGSHGCEYYPLVGLVGGLYVAAHNFTFAVQERAEA
jgi:hypothetical protein